MERIPWVEHATVMRILPNELRVSVRERIPVAFVRVGDQIKLVDAAGVILDMSPAMMASRKFSFPVVTGVNPTDPLRCGRPGWNCTRNSFTRSMGAVGISPRS